MKKSDKIFEELMQIESKKGTVWDDRKRDLDYIDHKNNLRKIRKKVDNNCPFMASNKFFNRAKYLMKQFTMEERISANMTIVKALNKIQRSRVKIENVESLVIKIF